MRYRGSIAKWVLLVFALLLTLDTLKYKSAAIGSLTAGLWVSYAVLHAGDRLAAARRRDIADLPAESQKES